MMHLPRDAKFWSPRFRRQKLAEMVAHHSVDFVAELFGCSIGHVLLVCAERGVECPHSRSVLKQPKRVKRKARRKAKQIEHRPVVAKCCLACWERLPAWGEEITRNQPKFSYCAECAAELFDGKIQLPEQPPSSTWLVKMPPTLHRWYPLDESPWYANARRSYEGD